MRERARAAEKSATALEVRGGALNRVADVLALCDEVERVWSDLIELADDVRELADDVRNALPKELKP